MNLAPLAPQTRGVTDLKSPNPSLSPLIGEQYSLSTYPYPLPTGRGTI